jgi:hypothetical protein
MMYVKTNAEEIDGKLVISVPADFIRIAPPEKLLLVLKDAGIDISKKYMSEDAPMQFCTKFYQDKQVALKGVVADAPIENPVVPTPTDQDPVSNDNQITEPAPSLELSDLVADAAGSVSNNGREYTSNKEVIVEKDGRLIALKKDDLIAMAVDMGLGENEDLVSFTKSKLVELIEGANG